MRTYYDVLGVNAKATEGEIRSAYKKLVKTYHPDVNNTEEAQEKIKEINTAYEVVADPQLRKMYDLGLQQGNYQSGKPPIDPEKVRERREKKRQQELEEKRRNKIMAFKVMASVFVVALVLSGGIYWIRNNYVAPAPITDLSQRDLSKIPYGLEGSPVVNILYLHKNELKTLPASIGTTPNLLQLTLSDNQLTGLPPEIGNLKKLQSLDLSNNQLTSIPPEIGKMKGLTELYLSENPLTGLPVEAMAEMPFLKLLDVRGCKIPAEEIIFLHQHNSALVIKTE